jgi:hypothetical protein
MRSALALLVGCAALTAAAGAAAKTTPTVAQMILRPEQVGPGYVMFQRLDGHGVKSQVTLNLCGTNYPSESRRLTRLQTNYLHPGTTLGVSNEVVTYRPGGAAQAIREVTQHAINCPHHPVDTGIQGLPKLLFEITRIQDPRLLKGYLAVRIRASGIINGKHVSQVSYAVYQHLGDVFSGVYSFAGNGPSDAAQLRLCLHAAEQSAQNLRNGGAAPSGPTA